MLTIKEYNETVHKQTKNADVFIANLESAIDKSGYSAEVMKQLNCIGWSEDTLHVIRKALDTYRTICKLDAQANARPATTALELVAQLRKMGLSNGSALGRHCGVADEAADWIEAQIAEEQAGKLLHLPCTAGETVYRICPQCKPLPYGRMWSGKTVKTPCDRCSWSCCDCTNIGYQADPRYEHIVKPVVFQRVGDIVKAMPYFGTVFHLSEEAAQAYLTEREADNG